MRTVAIANQKGGCGKTTTAVNMSASLAFLGARVLLVDLDPQGHSALSLGIDPDELEATIYDVLSPASPARTRLTDVVIAVAPGLHLVPSQLTLSALEQDLAGVHGRERKLSDALESVAARYDFAILDCAPGLGIATFNALYAAQEALIPVDTSVYSLHGLGKFLETVMLAERSFGKRLGLHLLMTRYNARTRMGRDIRRKIADRFDSLLMSTTIRNTVRLAEAAANGRSIADFDRGCTGFMDYMRCATEFVSRKAQDQVRPPWFAEMTSAATAATALARAANRSVSGRMQPVAAAPARLPNHGPVQRSGLVRFDFDDTEARQVEIAGRFNDWEPEPLVRSSNGRWTIEQRMDPGTHPYQFIVDGEWTEDPANDLTCRNSFGGVDSIVEVAC